MNYVNKRDIPCPHCNKNIDTHAIPIISSDTATEQLAKKLQEKLDGVYVTALSKGYVLPVGATMVGAAIATIGSKVVKVAALSGANANLILSFIQGGLGNDVKLVGDNVAPANFKTLLLDSLSTPIAAITTGMAAIPDPKYPVGSCAGQKIIQYLVSQSNPTTARIKKINMAEIFWKSGGKSAWSTGQLVESCNTCNRVLPMLLCNYNNDGEKVPYNLS
ncbi:hypothetical protein [Pedobacter sp. CFBP9032]|uniref:hypothetical protein n=1 Tax=Pedobacter sp. CFBP9032 TaxID=3096539 RepID=UPI002A6B7B29|nr:hypothetical protein [Pedobacter sp. CFBP9032]MDY0907514.1 hypothetical protein [Pedobacter sp. CFBP9032]